MADSANDLAEGATPSSGDDRQVSPELVRVNRAVTTLRAGNHTLLRACAEQELLRDMCQVIVEVGGYRAAGVAYAEHDDSKGIRWKVCMGMDVEFLQSLPFTWAATGWGRSAIGTAIRTGKPSVARNYFKDPSYVDLAYERWRAYALEHGYAVSTAIPLLVEGEMLGALIIVAPEIDAFDEHEVALLAELGGEVAYGIASLRTRERHRDAQAALARLAYYDSLTGLSNRVHLVDRLDRAMHGGKHQTSALALLYLEIGRFHEINKVLGYQAGDALVQVLARRLAHQVQADEMLARVGETQFALLLPNSGVEYAVHVAQRLADALHEPVDIADLVVDPRVGIGVALFPDHATDADALMRRANAAVREINPTRGGYAIYTGGQEQKNTRRLALMGDLHRAIKNSELQLYCQPKVDIATRQVRGAEALVRWHHPHQGLIPTSEFIQLAEHAGTITPLTNWMLEAAFNCCEAWQKAGVQRSLAVNLSAHDLYDPGLIDRIRGLFATSGIAPSLIQFELTESSLMADPAGALETLTRLKQLDVELFIDDYGTGYSSLSYLQKLPVDAIKIDQAFVMPMVSSADSAVIVSSTIELGHNLGLKVVAEGVETQAVWDRLAALKCDVAQGYLISKPMPAEQFTEWERAWSNAQIA